MLQNFTLGSFAQGAAGGGGSSFESIATVTASGSSQTITFSSIPSTYQHLQIRGIVRSSESAAGTNYNLNFNGDSGSNYAYHRLVGNGSSATASASTSNTKIFIGRAPGGLTSTGLMGVLLVDIHDYASTTKNKTVRAIMGQDTNNAYAGEISFRSGVWLSTNAITSITFTLDNPNFTNTTTFALYGIKGA